jgi:hypothetical protein
MNSGPVARHESGGGQPLLWAALAFAAGIATGVHAWRPPLWWVAAWIVFALAGAYLFRRRGPPAFILGLGALFLLGALMVQVRGRDDTGGSGLLRFADGTEVIVTAHVTKEGTPQEDGPGSIRQRLEVETERISRGNQSFAVNSGMRINVYQPQLKNESDQQARAARLFRYGERLRFPGKTSALLEGDAERKAEQQIAEEQPEADLLKVAHHGSAASTIPL